MKILVIDDDEQHVNALAMVLRLKGHDVIIALDGLTGVMQASKVRLELNVIICDFQMPAGGGDSVWQRLSGIGLGGLPFIFISGLGADEVRRQIGADLPNMRFFGKPFQYAEVLSAIQELTVAGPIPKGPPAVPPPAPAPAPATPDEPLDLDAA